MFINSNMFTDITEFEDLPDRFKLHPKIDKEHLILFKLYFKSKKLFLHNNMEEAVQILNDLLKYSVEHFSHEEELMGLYEYPEIKEHIERHSRFIHQVVKLKNLGMTEHLYESLIDFFKEWICQHIVIFDKNFVEYIKERGL